MDDDDSFVLALHVAALNTICVFGTPTMPGLVATLITMVVGQSGFSGMSSSLVDQGPSSQGQHFVAQL